MAGLLESSALAIIVGSILFFATKKRHTDLSIRDGYLVVTGAWLSLAFFGAFPYYLTGAIPSFTDAFFESMSGFTTTGSTILTDIEIMPKSLLFWRSFSQWIGGMGIIVLSIAILPLLRIGGMQLFKAEVPGPTTDKLTPRISQTAKLLWLVYFGITIAEILLLWVGPMNLFDAVCHGFTTMATGGFSTKNASIGGYNSAYVEYVVTFFMLVAGINFTLHYYALTGKISNYWKDNESRTYLMTILVFTIIIMFSNFVAHHYDSVADAFRYAVFQVVSIITTTGYGSADYETWTPLAQKLLLILMFIGGSAGSTGGGMKVIRIIVVIKQGFIELRKILHPNAVLQLRIGKKVVHKDIVSAVMGFFILYMALFTLISISLSFFHIDMMTAISASATCLSNVGPGFGLIGPTENFAFMPAVAKWILSLAMILGRLEIYTILVIFTKHFWKV
ncbi:MAG: TrkH family potassium uptake protein [Calditrichia bacterium]